MGLKKVTVFLALKDWRLNNMKFEEVLSALREGKKIKRSSWPKNTYLYNYRQGTMNFKDGEEESFYYDLSFFLDNYDWEIVEEKKKVKLRDLTKEQYREYGKGCADRICNKCPFHKVECNPQNSNCWFYHKDLYSDKFLDREIEIESE